MDKLESAQHAERNRESELAAGQSTYLNDLIDRSHADHGSMLAQTAALAHELARSRTAFLAALDAAVIGPRAPSPDAGNNGGGGVRDFNGLETGSTSTAPPVTTTVPRERGPSDRHNEVRELSGRPNRRSKAVVARARRALGLADRLVRVHRAARESIASAGARCRKEGRGYGDIVRTDRKHVRAVLEAGSRVLGREWGMSIRGDEGNLSERRDAGAVERQARVVFGEIARRSGEGRDLLGRVVEGVRIMSDGMVREEV